MEIEEGVIHNSSNDTQPHSTIVYYVKLFFYNTFPISLHYTLINKEQHCLGEEDLFVSLQAGGGLLLLMFKWMCFAYITSGKWHTSVSV